MGKLNEIQEQTTQSWGDNSFTTKITNDTVEFDSARDSFTFKDEVNVPSLAINGHVTQPFTSEEKTKLSQVTTPMNMAGRVDSASGLPTEDVQVGDVYLVGLSGSETFEEYVCVEVSGSPATPVWENLGHVKIQADWNQTTSTESNYIKNKPAIKAGQGVNSIIEGNQTAASGDYSHVEGIYATASGNYSHAEGGGTTASGSDSHSEGEGTKASGPSSHAEGGYTTASGPYSHAEGQGTTASFANSHAEGSSTTASAVSSHAEGASTKASFAQSHAEGTSTTASGYSSHAEGNQTTASGNSSHTEGGYTTASQFASHAEGSNTTASGNSSHAEGGYTTASGESSHAEGSNTTTTGNYSHTEGNGTIANNKCQHVFGEYNGVDPSSALSSARGTYIEIVGNGADATNRSNARTLDWSGNETLSGNLTIGGAITTNGQQILPQKQADWSQTTSTESNYIKNKPAIKAGQGLYSIAEGAGTTASGYGSHAEGTGTTASGTPSHAEGSSTTASGSQSHAEGTGTTASFANSHAEGSQTTASGYSSHAEGNQTAASGDSSHAEGGHTTASQFASHAEGSNTTASGEVSHAEGRWTTAKNKSQHVFGEFNIADPSTALSNARGNYVEIVGNGTDDDARSNARTLDWSGNETLSGNLTIGGTITAINGVKTTKITIAGVNPADEYMYSEIIDASSDVALTRVLAGTSSTKTDGYVEILYKVTTGVTCSAYIDSADVALTADGAWHKLEQGCNPGHGVEIHVNNSSPVTGATLEVISKVYYI